MKIFLLIASLRFVWKVMLFWAGVFINIPNRRANENVFIILLPITVLSQLKLRIICQISFLFG
jgi:hypothetical protein